MTNYNNYLISISYCTFFNKIMYLNLTYLPIPRQ